MASEADKLVDEKAIAEHFGINRAAWIRAVRFRGCPHYRLGRLVLYHGDKLVKWLDENLETRQGVK
jgi:hypothetical protein